MTSPPTPPEPDSSDASASAGPERPGAPVPSHADPGAPATPPAPQITEDARGWPIALSELIDGPAVVLTVVVTLAFLMFMLTEPTAAWLALFVAAVAAVGTDRVLRLAHPRSFELGLDPTLQVPLPALYALAAPVLLEDMVRGGWALPAALLAGGGFGAILFAQVHSARPHERWLAVARPATSAAAYVTAFAVLTLTYAFELGLVAAIVAVALAAGLLAVELLRDGHADPADTFVLAGVVALVVGLLRWTLHYVPLDGYLAALTLLLGFFLASGLLHAHLTLELRRGVMAQYIVIAAVGGALIIGARSAGLA